MRKTTFLVTLTAGLLLGVSAVSVVNADDVDKSMMAFVGEFEVGNGETHPIAHHKTDKEYRICVRKARHAVPLKVMYDDKEETVAVGSCTDFEAKNIKVTPAGKLDNDTVLIGKFQRLNNG